MMNYYVFYSDAHKEWKFAPDYRGVYKLGESARIFGEDNRIIEAVFLVQSQAVEFCKRNNLSQSPPVRQYK